MLCSWFPDVFSSWFPLFCVELLLFVDYRRCSLMLTELYEAHVCSTVGSCGWSLLVNDLSWGLLLVLDPADRREEYP